MTVAPLDLRGPRLSKCVEVLVAGHGTVRSAAAVLGVSHTTLLRIRDDPGADPAFDLGTLIRARAAILDDAISFPERLPACSWAEMLDAICAAEGLKRSGLARYLRMSPHTVRALYVRHRYTPRYSTATTVLRAYHNLGENP